MCVCDFWVSREVGSEHMRKARQSTCNKPSIFQPPKQFDELPDGTAVYSVYPPTHTSYTEGCWVRCKYVDSMHACILERYRGKIWTQFRAMVKGVRLWEALRPFFAGQGTSLMCRPSYLQYGQRSNGRISTHRMYVHIGHM